MSTIAEQCPQNNHHFEVIASAYAEETIRYCKQCLCSHVLVKKDDETYSWVRVVEEVKGISENLD
jgi:hypothetical protein